MVDHFDFADGEGGGKEDGDAVVGRYLGIHGVAAHPAANLVLQTVSFCQIRPIGLSYHFLLVL